MQLWRCKFMVCSLRLQANPATHPEQVKLSKQHTKSYRIITVYLILLKTYSCQSTISQHILKPLVSSECSQNIFADTDCQWVEMAPWRGLSDVSQKGKGFCLWKSLKQDFKEFKSLKALKGRNQATCYCGLRKKTPEATGSKSLPCRIHFLTLPEPVQWRYLRRGLKVLRGLRKTEEQSTEKENSCVNG